MGRVETPFDKLRVSGQQLCSVVVTMSNHSLLERGIENETTQGAVGMEKFLNAPVPYAILNLVGE